MKDLNLYILTFNCARTLIQPDVFGSYMFDAIPSDQRAELPDLLVLSLQEIAPIGFSFLGGSFLTPYYGSFHKAVEIAAGEGKYVNIIARNIGMTAIMIFAKTDVASRITSIQTGGVGVGVQETGNKGAVAVRLGLELDEHASEILETTFVAAHLAPMEWAVEERNQNWKSIVQGVVFTSDKKSVPITEDEQHEEAPLLQGLPDETLDAGIGIFSPRSYLFVAGDLNYRTSAQKPGMEAYKRYPRPNVPRDSDQHYSAFFQKDQLTQEKEADRTLQGLTEAPIDFPPTYKYGNKPRAPAQTDDIDSWDWAKHRVPSWCDRILYLDVPSWMKQQAPEAVIQVLNYNALPLFSTSDHRPVAMFLTLPTTPISQPPANADDVRLRPPFKIDAQWKNKRATARKKELVIGLLAYLGLTWEGKGLLAATVIGAVGGYFIIRSLLAT